MESSGYQPGPDSNEELRAMQLEKMADDSDWNELQSNGTLNDHEEEVKAMVEHDLEDFDPDMLMPNDTVEYLDD